MNADGTVDLIVVAGFGGGPRVSIWDGFALAQGGRVRVVSDFFAFEETLRDGVFVSAGDLNADKKAELLFGGGPGVARVCGLPTRADCWKRAVSGISTMCLRSRLRISLRAIPILAAGFESRCDKWAIPNRRSRSSRAAVTTCLRKCGRIRPRRC